MYVPEHFSADRRVAAAIVRAAPLATLVVDGCDSLEANHVPMADGSEGRLERLVGHVARRNPLAASIEHGARCLAIFSVAGSYISPQWYGDGQCPEGKVPTWNYAAVHVQGRLRPATEEEARAILRAAAVQGERSVARTWSLDDLPAPALQAKLAAILCFVLEVGDVQAKLKVGQNLGDAHRAGMLRGLEASGTHGAHQLLDLLGTACPYPERR